MSRVITGRTLRQIKEQAKDRLNADPSLTHCQHLERVAREFGVGSFHEAITIVKRGRRNSTEPFNPLEGMNRQQREAYYDFMVSALDREILDIYPESREYYSDSDFDHDEY